MPYNAKTCILSYPVLSNRPISKKNDVSQVITFCFDTMGWDSCYVNLATGAGMCTLLVT